jgi:hypothetical protein
VSLEDIVLAYLSQSRDTTAAEDHSPGSRRNRHTNQGSPELVLPVSTIVERTQPASGIATHGDTIREGAEQ